MNTIPSPFERTFPINGEKLDQGRRLALDTHKWMEHHKDAFLVIYTYVKVLQINGVKGRIRDRVARFCIDHGIKVGDDSYRFANAYWAGISRYLVLYDKSLKYDPIEAGNSAIDCWGLYPVSWLGEL